MFTGHDILVSDWNFPKLTFNIVVVERVGVKVIDKTKLDSKTTKMLLREIKVMDACNHSNLVRLYEVLENKTKLYFIMQFGEGGELFTKITSHGQYGDYLGIHWDIQGVFFLWIQSGGCKSAI